jgi:hypothetical protein
MNRGILAFYCLAVTCGLVVTLLRAQDQPRPAAFDTITVHRINVVGRDGTLRMVISNQPSPSGAIRDGKEESGTASVVLNDAAGKKRLAMEVQPDGTASLAFFDSAGKVLWKVVPTTP